MQAGPSQNKKPGESSNTDFFEGATIGLRLDRPPGRPVHTDSNTTDSWGPGGGAFQIPRRGLAASQTSLLLEEPRLFSKILTSS